MCVCATAKRRRREMKLDKRFKKRSPETSARRLLQTKQTEARMKAGKK